MSPSVNKLDEQKPVLPFHLTFLLKKDGESMRACMFPACKNSRPSDIYGLCRGAIINLVKGGSTLASAAKQALIDRVKDRGTSLGRLVQD